jgi:uncharacterized protein Veg
VLEVIRFGSGGYNNAVNIKSKNGRDQTNNTEILHVSVYSVIRIICNQLRKKKKNSTIHGSQNKNYGVSFLFVADSCFLASARR